MRTLGHTNLLTNPELATLPTFDPTTSGKKSDPERAGSFAVWFR